MMPPSGTQAAEAHVDNPFIGATAYLNQDYSDLVDTSIALTTDASLAAKMETVKSYPTAVWIDRIAAIYGEITMPDARASRSTWMPLWHKESRYTHYSFIRHL